MLRQFVDIQANVESTDCKVQNNARAYMVDLSAFFISHKILGVTR